LEPMILENQGTSPNINSALWLKRIRFFLPLP
jgi:hypothetical protein